MGSKTAQRRSREAARQQIAAMRRADQARERRRRVLIWGGAAVALVALIGVVVAALLGSQAARPSLAAVRTTAPEAGHVTGAVQYPQSPPAGGPHNPVWLNCGAYSKPVQNENAVHSLEHGAAWVTYRPGLSAEGVAALRAALPDTYTLLSPYPGLKAPVVVSTWGRQLALKGVGDKRLGEFVREYRLSSAPEPGAPCTGGIGG